jgi:hypothetical protein
VVLSLLAVPCIILTRAAFVARSSPHGYSIRQGQRLAKVLNLGSPQDLAPWQEGQFFEVGSAEVVRGLAEAVKRHGAALSKDQRDKLLEVVDEFLRAYSGGRFEDYLGFKTNRVRFRLDFGGMTQDLVRSLASTKTNAPPFPAEPMPRLRWIWEAVTGASADDGIGPRLLKVEQRRFMILISRNRDSRSRVVEQAMVFTTMYPNFAPNWVLRGEVTPESILTNEGAVTTALLQVVGRYSSSDTASPMFVSYFWSEQSNRWFPWELAKFQAASFHVLF